MAKKRSSKASRKGKTPTAAAPQRKPRILWANPTCLLDTSSGAAISVREMLHQLVNQGYEVGVVGATIFDADKGTTRLEEHWQTIQDSTNTVVNVTDGPLVHRLVKTRSQRRQEMTSHEENIWLSLYSSMLNEFKPDLVWYYGGFPLEQLIPYEARIREIPSAAYLVNANYTHRRWCLDTDIVITDTQATADFYSENHGFSPQPVGKFINPDRVVAEERNPQYITFINPSLAKGAGIVVLLALILEERRPDIVFEVVESRGNWHQLVQQITAKLGKTRQALSNVTITPNTDDMRDIYGRSRILLAPSQWWESGARVLAEAMLNGIPAIATKYGGSQELIQDAGITIKLPPKCHEKPYTNFPTTDDLEPLAKQIEKLFDDETHYQQLAARAREVGEQQHRLEISTDRLMRAFAPLIRQRAGDKDHQALMEAKHKHPLKTKNRQPNATSSINQNAASQTKPKKTADQLLRELSPEKDQPDPGSVMWLIEKENQFGGLQQNVVRNRTSEYDPRAPHQFSAGYVKKGDLFLPKHIGGDRMSLNNHGYSIAYSTYLAHLKASLGSERLVLAEVGVLRGTGLAIWCDLFPEARVIGLDLDPQIFADYRPSLEKFGAFQFNEPEMHSFDQFSDGQSRLKEILGSDRIDVVIDDGAHTHEAIMNTVDAVHPFLSENFLYFIEDFRDLTSELKTHLGSVDCAHQEGMTVVFPQGSGYPEYFPGKREYLQSLALSRAG